MSKKSKNRIGSISQPPIVWGPSEGYNWAKTAYTGNKKKKHKRTKRDILSNPHFYIELDTKKIILLPDGLLQKFIVKKLNLEKIREEFDILLIVEKFLKALSHIKFKNINEIKIDKEIIYLRPEKKKDITETLELVIKQREKWKTSRSLHIVATKESHSELKAIITIKLVHRKKEHTIDVQFKGEIERKMYKQFVNYLKKNLKIKNVI